MDMILLDYRNQAKLIGELCEFLRPVDDDIHGETEEVLRLWLTADSTILKIVPPPARKLDPSWIVRFHKSLNPEY